MHCLHSDDDHEDYEVWTNEDDDILSDIEDSDHEMQVQDMDNATSHHLYVVR